MKETTLTSQKPLTEEEAFAEIDRLSVEIAGMLERANRSTEEARRMREGNRAKLAELERIMSCWND